MGKAPRRKQQRLAEKLVRIREALELSQSTLLKHLDLSEQLARTAVSSFESGDREPPLYVLLRYAKAAGVCLDVLVDDELDLPPDLPAMPAHSESSRNYSKPSP